MPAEPRALDPGWLFADRFEAKRVLGRGGFGIAYLAVDLLRGDLVVVKELAPQNSRRSPEGVLKLDDPAGKRLREQFLEEAGVLSRFNIKGVPPIRATFQENGTAYFATEYVPEAQTIDRILKEKGWFSQEQALDIILGLLQTLEVVHAKRILHRDIKPSNVMVGADGSVYLIDFGAAREWHADSTITQTVQHTPGYAPPEQLSERARRGPATDLYAVCATMFVMLAGLAPPSASDRAAGLPLPSLLSLRPELDPTIVHGIEAGLTLAYAGRPQTVPDLRDMLTGEFDPPRARSLEELDEAFLRLKRFAYDKKACPACKDLLSEPKPLKRYACPVCRHGTIRRREIHERLCPVCKAGVLSLLKNQIPPAICPACRLGLLSYRRKSLISSEQTAACQRCQSRFEVRSGKMARAEEPDALHTYEYWAMQSRRASEIWRCPDCEAQFDVLPDGRWEKVPPEAGDPHRVLYPDEWARVAVGLEPNAGNARCDACAADYYVEREHITLLDAPDDAFGFGADYMGRLLTLEDVRWLGAGKTSPHSGYVCEKCRLELDREDQYFRLVATTHRRFSRYVDHPMPFEDWHRIGQGLPTIVEEAEFESTLGAALLDAYRDGTISFDADGLILWKGEATRAGDSKSGTLTINRQEISFGGLLLKKRYPTDAIVGVWADDHEVHLQLEGEIEAIGFQVTPVDLVAHLASGDRKFSVGARDLAARLTTQLRL